MGYERIVAVYDSNAKAKDAARALESSGFSSSEISFIHRDSLSDKDVHDGNLWQRLFGVLSQTAKALPTTVPSSLAGPFFLCEPRILRFHAQ